MIPYPNTWTVFKGREKKFAVLTQDRRGGLTSQMSYFVPSEDGVRLETLPASLKPGSCALSLGCLAFVRPAPSLRGDGGDELVNGSPEVKPIHIPLSIPAQIVGSTHFWLLLLTTCKVEILLYSVLVVFSSQLSLLPGTRTTIMRFQPSDIENISLWSTL